MNQKPQPRNASRIAEELYSFAQSHITDLADGERHCYTKRPISGRQARARTHQNDLDGFPQLEKHFNRIDLTKPEGLRGPLLWQWNSAADVGINEAIICKRLQSKARKRARYDTSNTKEIWLVICAGVSIPHDSAGPAHPGNRVTEQIRSDAKLAGFDRVVLWDRGHGWHKDLV